MRVILTLFGTHPARSGKDRLRSKATCKPRAGFTLVELLVVIAIIGVLVALLLPAVQAAREAARRTQCTNNLKQLGLAMQNFHDAYGSLPIGSHGCCRGTWMVFILPYIEEQQVRDLFEDDPTSGGLEFQGAYYESPVSKFQLPVYTCPTDQVHNYVSEANGARVTRNNYMANYGNTSIRQPNNATKKLIIPHLVEEDGEKFGGAPILPSGSSNERATKVTRFKQISDGLSKTMILAEAVQAEGGTDVRGLTWWAFSAGFTAYHTPNSTAADGVFNSVHCDSTFAGNPPCETLAGPARARMVSRSRHASGVNVAMCDGSVHFYADDIHLAAWRALATTQGAEQIQD